MNSHHRSRTGLLALLALLALAATRPSCPPPDRVPPPHTHKAAR